MIKQGNVAPMRETIGLLVQVHLVCIVSEPEQPLAPGEAITRGWLLPVLQSPPLHDAELLPGGAAGGQLPLQPGLTASVVWSHESHVTDQADQPDPEPVVTGHYYCSVVRDGEMEWQQ